MCFMSFTTHFSVVCSTHPVARFHLFQHTPPSPQSNPMYSITLIHCTVKKKALHLTITDPVSKNVRPLWTDGERWRDGAVWVGYNPPLLSTLSRHSPLQPCSSLSERERERQLRLCDSKWLLLYIPLWSARRQRREYYDDITGDSIDSRTVPFR